MTTVKTNLTIGKSKEYYFGENNRHSISMHDNPEFVKQYESVEDFLKDFEPTVASDNLIKKKFNGIRTAWKSNVQA